VPSVAVARATYRRQAFDRSHLLCTINDINNSYSAITSIMPTLRYVRATLPAINDNCSTSQSAQNGLRSAVESLKSLVNDEFECPICLETCTDTRTNPECLHRFCGDCINESLRRCNNECPSCRVNIPTKRTLREDKKFDHIVSKDMVTAVRCVHSISCCVVDILLTACIIDTYFSFRGSLLRLIRWSSTCTWWNASKAA